MGEVQQEPVGGHVTAALLRIGAGGPYAFAETWGPHHPDAWAHDWTQEGRSLTDCHPDEPYAESSARLNAQQRAKEDWLVAALAERSRGVLTVKQVAERLRTGGERYRDFLSIGSAAIARALNRARRDEEGAGRLRLREALDALEERHEVPDWAVDLTRTRLDDDLGARHGRGTGLCATGVGGVPCPERGHRRRTWRPAHPSPRTAASSRAM